MSETGVQSGEIHERGNAALADAHLQEAYKSSTLRLLNHRREAIKEVPGFERLRERGRELKREIMEHLDYYLGQFADNVEKNGGRVHWARTGEEACSIILDLARRAGASEVVKAKSMVSE